MTSDKGCVSRAGWVRRALIAICLLSLGFFWGGLTVHKRVFPFDQVREVKHFLTGNSSQNPAEPKPRNTIFQTFSPQVAVVMIGDSITQGAEWADMFPQVKIANRGIGDDKVDDILNRLEQVFSVNAKKSFVMAGINDIYDGNSVDRILSSYVEMVKLLQTSGTEVYIQSTLECSKIKCGKKLDLVRELNQRLESYAKEQGITYININEGLTTDSEGLLGQYSFDGVHLLGSGYLKWRENLSPYISP